MTQQSLPPAAAGSPAAAADTVAVVGMGLALPGAVTVEQFWALLTGGEAQITAPPAGRWRTGDFVDADRSATDKTYQQAGGFVTGLPDAGTDDYAQVWLRHCVEHGLTGVGRRDGDRFSLCLGYTADGSLHQEEALVVGGVLAEAESLGRRDTREIEKALRRRYVRAAEPTDHTAHRIVTNAIRGLMPADTRVHVVDTACSSSLYSIDLGMREILAGAVDIAVCGGAMALTPSVSVMFAKNGGLSPTGTVRALDAGADGVIFSDGAAVIVLKRLDRALADRDTVLGVVAGSGLSADGKGTSIYKPAPHGQEHALNRAYDSSGLPPDDVDLIVAHATGTPTGDLTELAGLRRRYRGHTPVHVVSNKSLVGHTGWAAGAVSVIHLLLAMRHGTIPAQYGFRDLPAPAATDDSRLVVPTTEQPWPRRGRPRAGAVSGFGFGGTNAHLLFQEYTGDPPARRPTSVTPLDELVLVGWASRQPDEGTRFGAEYPMPGMRELRLPPATVRRMDRTQLMLVQCVHQLDATLKDVLARRHQRVGVVVGHTGPTRNALLCRLRAHLDEIQRVLTDDLGPEVDEFLDTLRSTVHGLVPPITEDSYPGEMPNVISGRVANHFDLCGLNVTVDQGAASLLEAFEVAARYLQFGDIDLALVGAVNGNSRPEWQAMLGSPTPPHEGAFLFALTTRQVAAATGLPVLAGVDDLGVCGDREAHPATHLAGAEGGDELLAFLTGTAPAARIVRRPEPQAPARALTLSRPAAVAEPAPPAVRALERYELSLAPLPATGAADDRPFIPPSAVVLTNNSAALGPLPHDTTVIAVGDGDALLRRDGSSSRIDLSEAGFDKLLSDVDPTHIRVVCDLTTVGPRFEPEDARHRGVVGLHDAMFLAARGAAAGWTPRHSFAVLLLGGVRPDRVPHPLTGLFTGFTKALAREFASSEVYAVAHEAASVDATTDLRPPPLLPVAYHVGGQRLAVRARHRPAPATPIGLTRDSVVVAAGGGRGVGAELLRAVARTAGPRLYVLGTTRIDDTDTRPVADGRAAFIKARVSEGGTTAVRASRAFDHLTRVAEIRATLAELAGHCGSDRVTYLVCDLEDRHAVHAVIDRILGAEPRVDLLLNVAGRIGTAPVGAKSLAGFTAVRDLKLHAHANLTRAFHGRRPVAWCNVGSFNGYFGLAGDTDYAAGNDYLLHAAQHAAADGHHEHTIGFSLWVETGFVAAHHLGGRADLGRTPDLTPMTTAEGVGHFLGELAAPGPAGVVHLGSRERAAVERAAPGYFAWCGEPDGPAPRHPGAAASGYRVEEHDERGTTLLRVFDLERDGYLADHLVRGYPTLPASFYPELAATAAARLCPGRVPAVFTDLELLGLLRVHPGRRHPVRVRARLLTHGAEESVVRVDICGDVVAPTGQLLVRDRPYASVTVHLRGSVPAASRWTGPAGTGGGAAQPLYGPASPVGLAGMFRSLTRPRIHPGGREALLWLDRVDTDRWFANEATPQRILEGLVQLSYLRAPGESAAIGIPRTISSIELFAAPDRNPHVRLHGSAYDLDGAAPRDRGVAVTVDGLVRARMTGIRTAPLDGRGTPD
ncbi:SDR family NAD(P)-dependent oxidoreductase [Polymorphospora lycopeni]|uniref:SDR family NAD(P)-dependent oxidoreductase n=1 Tax=Polymorphospora lycopeni TaxID=3140240 RepID=A0ABV5CW94_9ACTN